MLQSFKDIVAEAGQLINELQNGLIKQEDKLSAFAQRQQEVGFSTSES